MTVTNGTEARLTDCEIGAWRGLLRAHARLVKVLDAELDAAHGLPLSSYEVLLRIAQSEDGRMRMRDLAESVWLSRSGLTRLIDRLERDRLVERHSCESDARGAYAVLTDEGHEVLSAARRTHRSGVREHFLAHFDDDELETFAAFWARVG